MGLGPFVFFDHDSVTSTAESAPMSSTVILNFKVNLKI
nr:MAG TPA: hypothetical protein [Caudoviricetes sp.]